MEPWLAAVRSGQLVPVSWARRQGWSHSMELAVLTGKLEGSLMLDQTMGNSDIRHQVALESTQLVVRPI